MDHPYGHLLDEEIFRLAVQLRHELHQRPELSNEEHWTKAHLMGFLQKNSRRLELVDRGRWFYAYFREEGENRRNIGFRADFDAIPVEDSIDAPYRSQVPGIGHKCGHDGHAAALAAFALDVDRRGADHNIFFVFQHAEEIGDGGQYAAEVVDEWGIQEIYAFHNVSGKTRGGVFTVAGTMCFASKGMEIRFAGTPAHASRPESGRNPAFAVASIVSAVPQLIAPEKYRGQVLCTVIQMDVGERAFGCSASSGKLLLTIRGQYEEEMEQLQAGLEALAEAEAERWGLEWEVAYWDVFPETANHPESVEKIRQACRELSLPVYEMEPSRGSEDFGYFLKRTKGAMFWLGNGQDYPDIHTVAFDFLDEQIREAVGIYRQLAK